MFLDSAEVLPSGSDVAFGAWLNLLLIVSMQAETERAFDVTEQHMKALLRRHPRGLGVLLVMTHDQRPPDYYSDRSLQILRRFRPQLLKVAIVLESQGFAAAAQRAVARTIILVSGMHAVITLHTDLAPATMSLAETLLPAEQRFSGVRHMRSAVASFRRQVRRDGER
jgi:hypothetical protein